jgi:cytochrome c
MKRILFIISAASILTACTNNTTTKSENDTVSGNDQAAAARQSDLDTSVNNIGTDRTADAPAAGAFQKGAQLIAGSDCLSCHKEKERLVGPAYVEVAKKYKDTDADKNYLVGKIIKGGAGVWGNIPMAPHPALSEANAKEMVNYILSLKK